MCGVTGNLDQNLAETRLSDRALLLHALQHIEEIMTAIGPMAAAFARWAPMLDALAPPPGAPPDAVTAAQTLRGLRRIRGQHRVS